MNQTAPTCSSTSEPSPASVVLAFSGGLDTSFCIPWLIEHGYAVHTVFANTGGVDTEERTYIEQRAAELGATSHVTIAGGPALWDKFVRPFVWAGEGYQGQYPLLVSDRYLIVEASLQRADELGTRIIAHGCTGMGNDQVRFDLSVKSLGDYHILAPIREIQKEHPAVRAYEQAFLEQRGFAVRAKQKSYTINENLLGVTLSGGEVDRWQAPGAGARGWCAAREQWPASPLQVRLQFEQGEAVALDDIYDVDADVYSPCALGGTVNEQTLSRLKCKVICGAANNQLATDAIGDELAGRGILYAPDYAVNSGGVMNVSLEIDGYNRERAMRMMRTIYYNLGRIFKIADQDSIPTYKAADRMAEERIAIIGRTKLPTMGQRTRFLGRLRSQ